MTLTFKTSKLSSCVKVLTSNSNKKETDALQRCSHLTIYDFRLGSSTDHPSSCHLLSNQIVLTKAATDYLLSLPSSTSTSTISLPSATRALIIKYTSINV